MKENTTKYISLYEAFEKQTQTTNGIILIEWIGSMRVLCKIFGFITKFCDKDFDVMLFSILSLISAVYWYYENCID